MVFLSLFGFLKLDLSGRHVMDRLLDEKQERLKGLLQVRNGGVLFFAVRQPVGTVGKHHNRRHVRHHLGGIVKRPGGQFGSETPPTELLRSGFEIGDKQSDLKIGRRYSE